MRVVLVHSRKSGSTYHRVEQPALAVREADLGVEVVLRAGLSTRTVPVEGGEPEVVDVDTESADVVVVQLPKTQQMLQCIQILKAKGDFEGAIREFSFSERKDLLGSAYALSGRRGEARRLQAEIRAIQGQMLELHHTFQMELRRILTPSQFEGLQRALRHGD